MWRSFFLGVGIALIIIGAECMVVEKVVVAERVKRNPDPTTTNFFASNQSSQVNVGSSKSLNVPEWLPWGLISIGAVTVLYSFTIPKRVKD